MLPPFPPPASVLVVHVKAHNLDRLRPALMRVCHVRSERRPRRVFEHQRMGRLVMRGTAAVLVMAIVSKDVGRKGGGGRQRPTRVRLFFSFFFFFLVRFIPLAATQRDGSRGGRRRSAFLGLEQAWGRERVQGLDVGIGFAYLQILELACAGEDAERGGVFVG